MQSIFPNGAPLPLLLGVAAVKDDAYFKRTTAKIAATRERVKQALKELGFTFPDAKSNFIFATHETCPAEELFKALRERHIYVRYFPGGRTGNHLRITVGTREEMEAMFAFLKKYMNK